MTFYYTTKGKVKVDKQTYMENVIDEFPINTKKYQALTSSATKTFKGGRK